MANDNPAEAQRAFERARNRVEEQMTPKQLRRLGEMSSLDHFIGETQRIGKALEGKSKSSRVRKLALGTESYARIVEGVCKLAPLGGDLIWGIVSFILDMAKGDTDAVDEVLGFLTGMAEEIKHLRMTESAFGKSSFVVGVVEAVYVAIIEFWVTAMEYYMKKLDKAFIRRIKRRFTSSRMMLNKFIKLKESILAQKARLHEVEATQYHVDEQNERVRRQQKELSDFIDPPDYEHHLRAAKGYRHDGTCEWLRDRPEYRNWMEGQSSSLLVIYGTAGAGKTVLSSWLVDETQTHSPRHTTIYHYFKETDDSCNTALTAVRSLLDQIYNALLTTSGPLLATLESNLHVISGKKHVYFDSLWSILSSLLSQYSQLPQSDDSPIITIVLDAMDECKDSKQLVQRIRKLIHATSNRVRVVVTGRQSGDHVDEFRRDYADQARPAILVITQDDVANDIAAFVTYSIKQIERLDYLKHRSVRDRVITTFSDVKNHEGMFLWAYLMCKEVDCQLHVADIWNLLKRLPKGLDGMYARICKRLSDSDDSSRRFSRQVLEWIVVSRRPMTFAELEEAIRVMSNDQGDFFDEDGGLLWSRRDIVRCCGDLVRYTGLAEGDTIGIIHLSAQNFLSAHPSAFPTDIATAIEPFIIDIPSLVPKISVACINYVLATAPHSAEYLLPPISFDVARTAGRNAFKKRYALFDYSAVYWMEYTLDVIQNQSHSSADQLQRVVEKVAELVHSPVFVIWVEELIRLTYTEHAENTTRRFLLFGKEVLPPDILHRLDLVMRVLRDFAATLRLYPLMLRLCLSHYLQIFSNNPDTAISDIFPLDGEARREWVQYNPITDALFSITSSSRYSLKCQTLNTGVRSRPVFLPLEENNYHTFSSATMSASGSRLAVTFKATVDDDSGYAYHTTCWDVNPISRAFSTDNWATLVFSHYHFEARKMKWARGGQIAVFGKNETIITPGGIFSLETQQCIDRPNVIYNPDFSFQVSDIQLSKDGERVVRIRDHAVEVLNIRGTPLYEIEFDNSLEICLYGFSGTGTKLAVALEHTKEDAPYSDITELFCILVDEAKRIEMPLPSHRIERQGALFTSDETRFVAFVTSYWTTQPSRVAVWSFLQDGDGSDHNRMDLIYIFDSPKFVGLVFTLVPGAGNGWIEDALIVTDDGRISRGSLGARVSPDKEEIYKEDWVLSSLEELVIWSIKRNGDLSVDKWSLKSRQPELVSCCTGSFMPIAGNRLFTVSPRGTYLATSTAIANAQGIPNEVTVCGLDLPGELLALNFSVDETRFACILKDENKSMFHVFDISQGPKVTLRASFQFPEHVWEVIFSPHNENLLAVNNYLVRLEDHTLTIQDEISETVSGFSGCGRYYYDWDLELYRLPDATVPESSPSMEIKWLEPTRLGSWYIYPPHKFGLRRKTGSGVIYLTHELRTADGSSTLRSRVIWVAPDTMPRESMLLIWPEENTASLKLLIVMKGRPKLIDTGIKKVDLMEDEEWVETDSSLY